MRYRQLFAAATFVVLSASCMVSEPGLDEALLPIEQKEITITATSGDMSTRTERASDGAVLWSPGDQISLFYGSGTNGGSCFTAQNTETAKTVNFTGTIGVITGGNDIDVEDTYFWAVYPYNATASCDGNSITTVLPSEQVATADTFADDLFPSMGRSQGLNMAFYNICGGIKFTVSEEGIKSVTLKGNSGEQIAGTITANFDSNNLPAVTNIADGTDTITLSAPEGETLIPGKAYYIVLVPTVFESGFTLTFSKGSTCAHKEFTSTISIRRSVFGTLTTPDKELEWEVDVAAQLALEREALVAFYNAMDGDNWINKENWCSERPVGEWYGVCTSFDGFVSGISLMYNNLNGVIPNGISCMKHITTIQLDGLTGPVPESICELSKLISLQLSFADLSDTCIPESIENLSQLQSLDLTYWDYATTHDDPSITPAPPIHIPTNIFSCGNLISFRLSGNLAMESFSGFERLNNLQSFVFNNRNATISIPASLGSLTNLKELYIICKDMGSVPSTISNLNSLERIILWGYQSFDIRDVCNSLSLRELSLEGAAIHIPPEIGSLKELRVLYGPFIGQIPEELGLLNKLEVFDVGFPDGPGNGLFGGALSGIVPDSIKDLNAWVYGWDEIIPFHPNLMWDYPISKAPSINAIDVHGHNVLTSYANNPLTLLFGMYNAYDDLNPHINEKLLDLYNKYHNEGLEIVSWFNPSAGQELTSQLDEQQVNVPWHHYSTISYPFQWGDYRSADNYPTSLVDSNGDIVYFFGDTIDIFASFDDNFERLETFIDKYLGHLKGSDRYSSSDYSSDGAVTILQQSSIHNGPIVIVLGDGFSDRLISNGTFSSSVEHFINALFSEEPFNTYRNMFNIYSIAVVSENESYDKYCNTALGGWFGEGTQCGGNNVRAIKYALKGISYEAMDDAVIIVLMNKDAYAGTCYMYNPPSGDYGRGLSIAYFPTSSDTDTFNGLVSHEAGGHGFAKLADEYAYEYMGAISEDAIANTRVNEVYGWWKNVDFTNDPSQVKWSQFLSDERYANEGLGCYEGGLTYWTGVWRPTENSIMRYNTGGFNAPSRYAIWYRINKLAYGESWDGTYEDFVAFDAPNRTPAATARRAVKRANYVEKQFQPLAPPVVVGHSWREELQKSK